MQLSLHSAIFRPESPRRNPGDPVRPYENRSDPGSDRLQISSSLSAALDSRDPFDLPGIQVHIADPPVHVALGMPGARGAAFPDNKFPRGVERESMHEVIKSRTDGRDRLFRASETRISALGDIVAASTESPIVITGLPGRILREYFPQFDSCFAMETRYFAVSGSCFAIYGTISAIGLPSTIFPTSRSNFVFT